MKKAVYLSLFSAFICVGAFIQIPLPIGVPVVIQDMMAILAGFLLGPIYGSLSVLVFLILGSIGLPVFYRKSRDSSNFPRFNRGIFGGIFSCCHHCRIFCPNLRKNPKIPKTKRSSLVDFL